MQKVNGARVAVTAHILQLQTQTKIQKPKEQYTPSTVKKTAKKGGEREREREEARRKQNNAEKH